MALTSVSTPNQIVSAIGESLQLDFDGQPDLAAHLLSELGKLHILLILDNFEHLLAIESAAAGMRTLPLDLARGSSMRTWTCSRPACLTYWSGIVACVRCSTTHGDC